MLDIFSCAYSPAICPLGWYVSSCLSQSLFRKDLMKTQDTYHRQVVMNTSHLTWCQWRPRGSLGSHHHLCGAMRGGQWRITTLWRRTFPLTTTSLSTTTRQFCTLFSFGLCWQVRGGAALFLCDLAGVKWLVSKQFLFCQLPLSSPFG